MVAQYVDDFPQLECEGLVGQGCDIIDVMVLLGWEIKKVEGTIPTFGWTFSALGVNFDLNRQEEDKVVIQDKPERAARITGLIRKIVDSKYVNQKSIAVLQGILAYTRAQCFGRCGAVSLHYLSALASGAVKKVDNEVVEHLLFWPKYLEQARPRIVRMNNEEVPVLIYVDGAEEEEEEGSGVGVGALIHDPATGLKEAFGGEVPKALVDEWHKDGGKIKVIHQAELYPSLLALQRWAKNIAGRRVILFVDNDGARGSLLKGVSRSRPSARIVQAFWQIAAAAELYIWVDRVPSKSNPADGPSRGEFRWLIKEGYRIIVIQELIAHRAVKWGQ
jgi:hypothetical protein